MILSYEARESIVDNVRLLRDHYRQIGATRDEELLDAFIAHHDRDNLGDMTLKEINDACSIGSPGPTWFGLSQRIIRQLLRQLTEAQANLDLLKDDVKSNPTPSVEITTKQVAGKGLSWYADWTNAPGDPRVGWGTSEQGALGDLFVALTYDDALLARFKRDIRNGINLHSLPLPAEKTTVDAKSDSNDSLTSTNTKPLVEILTGQVEDSRYGFVWKANWISQQMMGHGASESEAVLDLFAWITRDEELLARFKRDARNGIVVRQGIGNRA